jgi:hypothetical protein
LSTTESSANPRTNTSPEEQTSGDPERLIRAYMDGAESGMVEVRGYGLTADERQDAEQEARYLYAGPVEAVAR